MTPQELRDGLLADRKEIPRLIKDFWFFTGCVRMYLVSLNDEKLMTLWAKFVVERIEEVS